MRINKIETPPGEFKPFTLCITAETSKDRQVLRALFTQELIVPAFLAHGGHLGAFGVSVDDLTKFMFLVHKSMLGPVPDVTPRAE